MQKHTSNYIIKELENTMSTETRKHNSLQAALLAKTKQATESVPISIQTTQTVVTNTEQRYLFGINTTQYQTKPTNEDVRKIKNQLVYESKEYTLADLIDAVKHGCTICPAYIDESHEAHRAEYWKAQQIFMIDIDNADKQHNRLTDDKYITVSKAQQLLADNDIHAFFIYKSFHNKDQTETEPEFAKFRICISLDTLITNNSERERIIKALLSLFGDAADANCKNADRIFFGSTADCSVYEDTTAVTNKETLLKLYDTIIASNIYNCNSASLTNSDVDNKQTKHKKNNFDFDINVLLNSLNPDCIYDEWFEDTIAFKGAGGTKEQWMNWSAQSLLWHAEADAKKWEGIKGTSRAHLIKLAGKTIEGQTYMREMIDAQAEAIAKSKSKSKKSKQAALPTEEELLFAEVLGNTLKFGNEDDDYVPTTSADKVIIKEDEYVYKPYIPKEVYTVIYGEGGVGKTTFCCGIAAAISAGLPLPGDDDNTKRTPKKVLFISSDDTESKITKKLLNSGAILSNIEICDCDRVSKLSFRGEGLRRLKKLIQRVQPELVFIDPWQSFTGGNINLNRMEQVRPILQSVALLTRLFKCGIVLLSHVNKNSQDNNANNAASGSADFINAARSAIKIIEDTNPDNPLSEDFRLAVHTKSNYHKSGKTLSYAIIDKHVEWFGFSEINRKSVELAARKKISTHEALQQQIADKSDFTQLITAIVELSEQNSKNTFVLLYEELELYNSVGKGIWNNKADNQKATALKSIQPTLKLNHKLQIETGVSTSKTCFDGIYRSGRGISVTKLYLTNS